MNLCARFRQRDAVTHRSRRGRPWLTDARLDRHFELTHTKPRFQTATATSRQYGVSRDTVLRRFRHLRRPLRARRPYVGSIITRRHCVARLQWAQRHLRWQRRQWNQTLFSDKSKFNISNHDGRVRVLRKRGVRFYYACIVEKARYGRGA